MTAYNMASLHGKWSKQVTMPLGDRWGVPEGTSVADCLNWNHSRPKQPTVNFQVEADEREECRDCGADVTRMRTPVEAPLEETWRATSKTRQQQEPPAEFEAPPMSPHPRGFTKRPPTPKHQHFAQKSLNDENLGTPPAFQVPSTPKTTKEKRNRFLVKQRPPTPPMSFREFIHDRQRTRTPANNGPQQREWTPTNNGPQHTTAADYKEKFGSYPHVNFNPTPEDLERWLYESNQYSSSRPATPGITNASRGMKPKYTLSGNRSVVPATTEDMLKEKALIAAMRKHLFEYQSEREEKRPMSAKPPSGRGYMPPTPPPNRDNYKRSDYRLQQRPSSASNAVDHLYKAICDDSPYGAPKKVGFGPEDECYTYSAYNSRAGTPAAGPHEAWAAAARDRCQRHSQRQMYNNSKGGAGKYDHVKSRVDHRWREGARSNDTPGKMSLELDCPDKGDMLVSVRVKNTPVPVY